MTIYDMVCDLVDNDFDVYVNVSTRNLRLLSTDIIKNGEILIGKELIENASYEILDELFEKYYLSREENRKRRCLFCHYDEERDSIELLKEESMYTSSIKLESYLLLGIMSGQLKWENEKMYFKESEKHKEFILMKSWFE